MVMQESRLLLETIANHNNIIYFSVHIATPVPADTSDTKAGGTGKRPREKLMSGKQTPEYKKIQENYDKLSSTLVHQVLPGDLANKLFAAHLISEDLMRQANREIVDEAVRINNLLAAVHNQIELNCKMFQKFIKILEDYDQLTELLKLLKGTLHTSS